jgi:hypothetical protein
MSTSDSAAGAATASPMADCGMTDEIEEKE